MIPQNIKSAIDKYKSRRPTDEELTKLFDLVNSTKLEATQQVEVFDYLQRILDEVSINSEEQNKRWRARLDAERKRMEKNHTRYTLYSKLIFIGILLVFPMFYLLGFCQINLGWICYYEALTVILLCLLCFAGSTDLMEHARVSKKSFMQGIMLSVAYMILPVIHILNISSVSEVSSIVLVITSLLLGFEMCYSMLRESKSLIGVVVSSLIILVLPFMQIFEIISWANWIVVILQIIACIASFLVFSLTSEEW